jgi:hypothetical protein
VGVKELTRTDVSTRDMRLLSIETEGGVDSSFAPDTAVGDDVRDAAIDAAMNLYLDTLIVLQRRGNNAYDPGSGFRVRKYDTFTGDELGGDAVFGKMMVSETHGLEASAMAFDEITENLLVAGTVYLEGDESAPRAVVWAIGGDFATSAQRQARAKSVSGYALACVNNKGVAGVRFSLPEAGAVRMSILNAQGRVVARPIREKVFPAGVHGLRIDRAALAGGMYVVKMNVADRRLFGRLMIVR